MRGEGVAVTVYLEHKNSRDSCIRFYLYPIKLKIDITDDTAIYIYIILCYYAIMLSLILSTHIDSRLHNCYAHRKTVFYLN